MIGMLLQASGDTKGAAARFEQALRVDPDAAVAANNLAWIYAETDGNLDVALELAKTAQRRLPDSAEVNDTLGYIYYRKDIPSLAISTLKAVVEKDPRNAMYQYHLGLAYSKAGDTVHAKDHLTKALSLKPEFDGAAEARAILQTLAKSQS
jgi:tetratricopeptide (TPR) repeat protein